VTGGEKGTAGSRGGTGLPGYIQPLRLVAKTGFTLRVAGVLWQLYSIKNIKFTLTLYVFTSVGLLFMELNLIALLKQQ